MIGPGMGPRMALTGCLSMRILAMVRGRIGTHSLRRVTVALRNSLDRETTPWSGSCQSAMGSLRGSKQQRVTRIQRESSMVRSAQGYVLRARGYKPMRA